MCGKAARRAFRRSRSPPEAGCPAGRGRGLRGLAEEGAGTCRDKRLDFLHMINRAEMINQYNG